MASHLADSLARTRTLEVDPLLCCAVLYSDVDVDADEDGRSNEEENIHTSLVNILRQYLQERKAAGVG